MKTPLQEFIEWLKEYRLNTMSLMGIWDYEQGKIDVLSDVIKRATELLKKEREVKKTVEERALELYPELSSKEETYLRSNVDMQIQRDAFLKGVEFAQLLEKEQIEDKQVDYQKMFANCKLPNEKPQSSEGFSNIDMSDWHFCKVYGFREGIDKCSGCDQNKEDEPVEWSETTTPDGIKVSWVCSPLSDRPTNKDTQNDEELNSAE